MDLFLKILGIFLGVSGAVVVFTAKFIVKAYGMAEKQKMDLKADEETIEKLKFQKAIVKVKMIGGIIFLPGMLIILYVFK